MSSASVVFPIVTGLGCAGALAAARAEAPRSYGVMKAVASLAFIGTAVAAGATGAAWSSLALGALVLAAAGDVALAGPGTRGLRVGLGFFAAAHTMYFAAFVLHGTSGPVFAVTALVAALIAGGAWLTLRDRITGSMRTPVGVYLVIVAAVLAAGTATGISHRAWLLVCGVLLVVGSDAAVARDRFGKPRFANRLLGLPAYYVGQTLIALSLVGP